MFDLLVTELPELRGFLFTGRTATPDFDIR
jgi:hypothetical protein